MPDWTPLRLRARLYHQRMRAQLPYHSQMLVPAEDLLAAAAAATGVVRAALPPGDPLLAGAHAVLDREMETVWYADGANSAWQRFTQAHEFAHYWLHPDITSDACRADDDRALCVGETHSAPTAVGYSTEERRETEADLFAAEFLLPAPLIRRAFAEDGLSAARIAARVGVPKAWVLAQLMPAALLDQHDPVEPSPGDEAAAVPRSRAPQGADSLDESQRAAARLERGPVLVDAGPGTGKTRTLIARLLYLIDEKGVAPEEILALTFSNRAAEEMRTRLRSAIGDTAEWVWIGTFHAFGYEILRKYGDYSDPPRLIDIPEAVGLLEANLDRLNLREFENLVQPSMPFPDMLRCISRAKDELRSPQDYRAAAERQLEAARDPKSVSAATKSLEVAHLYAVYEGLLRRNGRLDFGDLLLRSIALMDSDLDVCSTLRDRFPHILADEYQDINRASAQMLRRLAGDGAGFWAVGDLRQAIYRFRGASPANVKLFSRDFPGGRRLRLDRNYRSRPPLVGLFNAAAAALFSEGGEGGCVAGDTPAESLWSADRPTGEGPAITVAIADDALAQADGLASAIRAWSERGTPLRDQVILCRTNAQAAALAERLDERGVPTQHLGDLFERAEVKDLLALLSLATAPEGAALARVAQFPEYGIPDADVGLLLSAAREAGRPFPAALALAEELPDISSAGRAGLALVWKHIRPLLQSRDAWTLLSRYLWETSGYLRYQLADGATASRRKGLALYQLLSFAQATARRLSAIDGEAGAGALLEHIRRLLACGDARSMRLADDAAEADAVRLMTVHGSKGLEFPVVYVPNLAKDQFPPRKMGRMAATPPGLTLEEEEGAADGDECLFFVALSRARDHVVLSRAAAHYGKPTPPSPLLSALDAALTACGAVRLAWRRDPSGGVSGPTAARRDDVTPEARPVVSLTALLQYRECPRRYFYQRVARLPISVGDGAYLTFRGSLDDALRWLQQERREGRSPTIAQANTRLARFWQESGASEKSPYVRLLRRQACNLLDNVWESEGPEACPADRSLIADLPHGRVHLQADEAERLPDGTLRLVRRFLRKASPDDHTDARIALLRHAARQQTNGQPVSIALEYISSGERVDVPESSRYEPKRVDRFDAALSGIARGEFAANPEARRCSQCPFLFICPI